MDSKKTNRIKVTYIDELGIPVKITYYAKDKVALSVYNNMQHNKFFNLIKTIELEKYNFKTNTWIHVK